MIKLLTSIVDIISSVISLVINVITSLINLLLHIPTYTDFLVSGISFLPTVIMPFALASVSIYVIFLLLNRGK